jgi:hypothetical protein
MAQRHVKVKKRKPSTVGDVIRRQLGYPSMIYDRPKTYAEVRKMRRELAPHNLKVSSIGRRHQWVQVAPLDDDLNAPLVSNWLCIADEIVFNNGGGC